MRVSLQLYERREGTKHLAIDFIDRTDPPYDARHRNASPSPPDLLGCNALSGLCTRCANCGLMPIGDEISIDR